MSLNEAPLIYGVDDKPPAAASFLAGFQHLLAVFGGIVTAPLIIALGMGLGPVDVNYLITSALFISGVATYIQISRFGALGSGLLSVQGTSFTFIGPLLYCFHALPAEMSTDDKLATIFGTAAVSALLMLPVVFHVGRLRKILTPAVSGATVMLLGLTLVWTTGANLYREFLARGSSGEAWQVPAMAALVFALTLFLAFSRNQALRMSSITGGLAIGLIISLSLGQVDFSGLAELDLVFAPEPLKYGLKFDPSLLLILLPVFLVSVTESIGDLTATSALSRLPASGPDYWTRIRGGLLGDSFNSFLAALFATFPNTTFSQNNGVIRLTGIASRRVGIVVAMMLMLLGLFPIVSGFFQLLPSSVVYGATMLMFILVGVAGVSIVQHSQARMRAWVISLSGVVGGIAVSQLVGQFDFLSAEFKLLLQFPVSTGALIAVVLEILLPKTAFTQSAGA